MIKRNKCRLKEGNEVVPHYHITSIQFLKILRDKYTPNRLKIFLIKTGVLRACKFK
jgi:hypothetical protein